MRVQEQNRLRDDNMKQVLKLHPNHPTAFEIYDKQHMNADYPYRLALILELERGALEQSRAYKMLIDWIKVYEKLSEITKKRHKDYLVLVREILLVQFNKRNANYSCLASFYSEFYQEWPKFNNALKLQLEAHSPHALEFLWVLCFTFLEINKFQEKHHFAAFLSKLYEEPLRKFRSQSGALKRKLIQIVFMLNVKEAQTTTFGAHSIEWIQTMKSCEQNQNQEHKVDVILKIVKCKSILKLHQESNKYWLQKIKIVLSMIQKIIPTINIAEKFKLQLISILSNVLEQPQIRNYIFEERKRFSRTLFSHMRYNCDFPQHAFNHKQYEGIKFQIYKIIYLQKKQLTSTQLDFLLREMLIKKKISQTLTNEQNLIFIQNITQFECEIPKDFIFILIKDLSNSLFRKNLRIQFQLIFIRLLQSSIKIINVTDELLGPLLKSLTACLIKEIDPAYFWKLRREIGLLYKAILENQQNIENKHVDVIFNFCVEYQKSSKIPTDFIIAILDILMHKQTLVMTSVQMFEKLTTIIKEIKFKITKETHKAILTQFFSLLIYAYRINKWAEGYNYLVTFFQNDGNGKILKRQIMMIIKQDDICTLEEQNQILDIIANWNNTSTNQISLNFIFIEILFHKLSQKEAQRLMNKIQKPLFQLMKYLYKDENYLTFIYLAAKCLPFIKNFQKLKANICYKQIKSKAFDILSLSFNKTSILAMNYFFCFLMLKTQNLVEVYKQLNRESFLDYLFQGLNDFITKERTYKFEFVLTLMFFKIIKSESAVELTQKDHTSIMKNLDWWIQAEFPLTFRYYLQTNSPNSIVLKELKEYYQTIMTDYFRKIQQKYLYQKEQRAKIARKKQQQIQ